MFSVQELTNAMKVVTKALSIKRQRVLVHGMCDLMWLVIWLEVHVGGCAHIFIGKGTCVVHTYLFGMI